MRDIIDHYLKHIPMPPSEKQGTPLRFCTECEFVWEQWSYGKHFFMKHPDMPTIYLKREVCCECEESEIPLVL